MGFSFGHSFHQSHDHHHSHRHAHRMLQTQAQLLTRLQLVLAIHGEDYSPTAQCPLCSHKLKPLEILKGFLDDPIDRTTKCPSCEARFTAKLIARGQASTVELLFLCAQQTLYELKRIRLLTPEALEKEEPAVYRSAIFHFGSIHGAYKANGADYPYPVPAWKDKIRPFLGRLPDVELARAVGKCAKTIRKMRTSRGIPRYLKSRAIHDNEWVISE